MSRGSKLTKEGRQIMETGGMGEGTSMENKGRVEGERKGQQAAQLESAGGRGRGRHTENRG